MKKFVVYFEQVDQVSLEVEAEDRRDALIKAVGEWRIQYSWTALRSVEEVAEDSA